MDRLKLITYFNIMELTDKLKHNNWKDIMILNKIAGRGMYKCVQAIRYTNNIGEALEWLVRDGIPCMAWAKEEDRKRFLSHYPDLETMQKRVAQVDYNSTALSDIKFN